MHISIAKRRYCMRMIIVLTLFCLSNVVFSNELEDFEAQFHNAKPKELPELAKNLSARGSLYHARGQFMDAIQMYKRSLKIRKEMGEEMSSNYALIVFLHSIAEHKLGNSCEAEKTAKKAIEIYKKLGEQEEATLTQKEGLLEFQKACQSSLVSKN